MHRMRCGVKSASVCSKKDLLTVHDGPLKVLKLPSQNNTPFMVSLNGSVNSIKLEGTKNS